MNRRSWFQLPDGPTLRAVLAWCLIIDVLFFAIYGSINWLTSRRSDLFELYVQMELAIPLVPEAIWVYLSMLLLFCLPIFTISRERARREASAAILALFVAAFVWLLIPARLGFERVIPEGYEWVYRTMFMLDHPHNLVPSLHVIFSSLAVFACGQYAPHRIKIGLWLWLTAIAVSTILTHQHHVLDVITGLLVAVVCRSLLVRPSARSNLVFTPSFNRENIV